MADDIDYANELAEIERQNLIRKARVEIPAGVPGECKECGEHSARLVGGRCAPCRDS